jgi:hypothetical protein
LAASSPLISRRASINTCSAPMNSRISAVMGCGCC